jgi:hypothetical protein
VGEGRTYADDTVASAARWRIMEVVGAITEV